MLVYAAAITPLTALSGLWWKQKQGDALSAQQVLRHEQIGFALVGALIVLAVWRYAAYRKSLGPGVAYLLLGLAVIFALVVQGALGGDMVFGG
jgi:uncharacterized membrane protein